MGWSMFLECQFAAIAAALANGGYIAYLVAYPDPPSTTVRLVASLATVIIFFALHAWGVQEQSRAMMVMTWGAIIGIVIFWIAAASHFSWERAWPNPALPAKGWKAVLEAVPYALWWLVIIETVALAAEEAHEPHRTIPRGLVWAQLTLIALVVLTWLFACGALDAQDLAVNVEDGRNVDYPLLKTLGAIPAGKDSRLLRYGFGIIAISGIVASYHGMVYGASRQSFALGRAGYLPEFLGKVHAVRRTPISALLASSILTAACVLLSLWYPDDVGEMAVLVSTLTALLWYILAMGCLFVLRKREPQLFQSYQAPILRVLPITVVALSLFAVYMYSVINVKVIPLTGLLYAVALGYFWFWAHPRIQQAAPEELAARQTRPTAEEVVP
jgi:ethanolamine permease